MASPAQCSPLHSYCIHCLLVSKPSRPGLNVHAFEPVTDHTVTAACIGLSPELTTIGVRRHGHEASDSVSQTHRAASSIQARVGITLVSPVMFTLHSLIAVCALALVRTGPSIATGRTILARCGMTAGIKICIWRAVTNVNWLAVTLQQLGIAYTVADFLLTLVHSEALPSLNFNSCQL